MRTAAADTSVTKVNSAFSPRGPMGQRYLAAGVHIGMRLWEEKPGPAKPESARDYETVGYVVRGRAELHIERPDGVARNGRFLGRSERGRAPLQDSGGVQGRGSDLSTRACPRPR